MKYVILFLLLAASIGLLRWMANSARTNPLAGWFPRLAVSAPDWPWVGYPALATVTVAAIVAAAYYGWSYAASAVSGLKSRIPSLPDLPSVPGMPDINWWKILLVIAAIAAVIAVFYLLRTLWRGRRAPTTPAPARTAWFPWKTAYALAAVAAVVAVAVLLHDPTGTCDGKPRPMMKLSDEPRLINGQAKCHMDWNIVGTDAVTVMGLKKGEEKTFTSAGTFGFEAAYMKCAEKSKTCFVETVFCPRGETWSNEHQQCGKWERVLERKRDILIRPVPRGA